MNCKRFPWQKEKKKNSRAGWRGEVGKRKRMERGIKMYYVHISTTHKECEYHILHKCINKLKFKERNIWMKGICIICSMLSSPLNNWQNSRWWVMISSLSCWSIPVYRVDRLFHDACCFSVILQYNSSWEIPGLCSRFSLRRVQCVDSHLLYNVSKLIEFRTMSQKARVQRMEAQRTERELGKELWKAQSGENLYKTDERILFLS